MQYPEIKTRAIVHIHPLHFSLYFDRVASDWAVSPIAILKSSVSENMSTLKQIQRTMEQALYFVIHDYVIPCYDWNKWDTNLENHGFAFSSLGLLPEMIWMGLLSLKKQHAWYRCVDTELKMMHVHTVGTVLEYCEMKRGQEKKRASFPCVYIMKEDIPYFDCIIKEFDILLKVIRHYGIKFDEQQFRQTTFSHLWRVAQLSELPNEARALLCLPSLGIFSRTYTTTPYLPVVNESEANRIPSPRVNSGVQISSSTTSFIQPEDSDLDPTISSMMITPAICDHVRRRIYLHILNVSQMVTNEEVERAVRKQFQNLHDKTSETLVSYTRFNENRSAKQVDTMALTSLLPGLPSVLSSCRRHREELNWLTEVSEVNNKLLRDLGLDFSNPFSSDFEKTERGLAALFQGKEHLLQEYLVDYKDKIKNTEQACRSILQRIVFSLFEEQSQSASGDLRIVVKYMKELSSFTKRVSERTGLLSDEKGFPAIPIERLEDVCNRVPEKLSILKQEYSDTMKDLNRLRVSRLQLAFLPQPPNSNMSREDARSVITGATQEASEFMQSILDPRNLKQLYETWTQARFTEENTALNDCAVVIKNSCNLFERALSRSKFNGRQSGLCMWSSQRMHNIEVDEKQRTAALKLIDLMKPLNPWMLEGYEDKNVSFSDLKRRFIADIFSKRTQATFYQVVLRIARLATRSIVLCE